MEDLREESAHLTWFAAPLFLATLGLIALLTLLLQKSITRPIHLLADIARRVSDKEDYSLRAPVDHQSELGRLGNDFNHMLAAVKQRDTELREARDLLEQRVSERTMALEQQIAERLKAELQLKKSEELFRALNEAAPVGIVCESADGIIRQSNPAFRQMFGYTVEELVGRSIDELIADCEVREEIAMLRSQVREGRIVRRTARRRTKGGAYLDIEVLDAPLLTDGKIVGMLAIYLDISKRVEAEHAIRESEECFRTLSFTAPVGIFRTDSEGRGVYLNERLCEIIGLSPERSLGFGGLSSIHPEDREKTMNSWMLGVEKGSELDGEARVLLPDGNINWIQ